MFDQAVSETIVFKKLGLADEIHEIKEHLKPITRTSILKDPTKRSNNTKNVNELFRSKEFSKFYYRNFSKNPSQPLKDDAFVQHAKLQDNLLHTEARLNYIRETDNQRRIRIEKQWRELEEKENELRQSFIMFNQFNKENSEKRTRALRKLNDDQKSILERQEAIKKFTQGMEHIRSLKTKMQEEIKKYAAYTDFLKGVTEISGEFTSSETIIKRFLELVEARTHLAKRAQEIFDILERAKDDLMKLIEEKNFIILGLNNQIANLQARYENANIKALESEALVTEIKNNAVKQMGEIDAVKNSIWNMYTHMAMSKKHKIKIKKERIEDQMMYINRTLTELVKVNKQIIAEQKKQQQTKS